MKKYVIGVDTGASKTLCGLFDEQMRLVRVIQRPTDAEATADELLDALDAHVRELARGAGVPLEIVRALATDPSLLLLDEPAAGMNPHETEELMDSIIAIRDRFQIAVMLIEHDMKLVMGICEGICVLNYGRIIAKGTAEEIQNDPTVIEAYLGRRKEDAQ